VLASSIRLREEAMLIERIDATHPTPFKFQSWTGKRLTTSFGWAYDFEAGRPVAAEPVPEWLLPIRDRAGQFARPDQLRPLRILPSFLAA
jgi:alkylated DNA repair protein (DNA oxidative demethylase)